MSSDLRIRRDRSALADGSLFGRRRRGLQTWKLALWLLAMSFMGVVVWQFNSIQPKVLAIVGTAPTATPPASWYFRNGDRAYWRGDLDTAIENYRQAAIQSPTNVDILYELARNLLYRSYNDRRNEARDIPEALKWAGQAVDSNPGNYRAYAINCFALLSDSQYEQAVRSCLRATDLNPTDADGHAFLSTAYAQLQRYDSALDEAKKAVEANDNSIDAHRSYAYALWYKGLFDGALENFEKAVSINPRLEFPYFELAGFAVGRNKYEMAITAYQRVLSMNSRSVKAYTRLCETYYRMGETPLAMDNCRNSITLDNQYTAAHKWLGQVYYVRRNYEGAIEELDTCANQEKDQDVQPDARFVECYYLRGLAWYYLDHCETAMPIFSDLLTWTHDKNAIDKTNQGIGMCAQKHPGDYEAPTAVPPTPTLPPPIQ
jgi:tetratricopeptide (TPR) repeat protein